MELGKGKWQKESDLAGLRDSFLRHMENYDRIVTLRCLSKSPLWHYELVEIPKALLLRAKTGHLHMKHESKQNPKPGCCDVADERGSWLFGLYFDGGTERKLQVVDLLKSACVVHGEWEFQTPHVT